MFSSGYDIGAISAGALRRARPRSSSRTRSARRSPRSTRSTIPTLAVLLRLGDRRRPGARARLRPAPRERRASSSACRRRSSGSIYSHTGMRRFLDAIGEPRTRELFLLGRYIDAPTALSWGLVNWVVADDELEATALELAAPARRQRAAGDEPATSACCASCCSAEARAGPRRRARAARAARVELRLAGPARGRVGVRREAPAELEGPLASSAPCGDRRSRGRDGPASAARALDRRGSASMHDEQAGRRSRRRGRAAARRPTPSCSPRPPRGADRDPPRRRARPARDRRGGRCRRRRSRMSSGDVVQRRVGALAVDLASPAGFTGITRLPSRLRAARPMRWLSRRAVAASSPTTRPRLARPSSSGCGIVVLRSRSAQRSARATAAAPEAAPVTGARLRSRPVAIDHRTGADARSARRCSLAHGRSSASGASLATLLAVSALAVATQVAAGAAGRARRRSKVTCDDQPHRGQAAAHDHRRELRHDRLRRRRSARASSTTRRS